MSEEASQFSPEQRVAAAYAELLRRAPEQKMQPRLGPVRALCEVLGEPQKAYPVILITGTNGKTSTARMIERILREHNLRTGRYSSPHLHRVNERIAVDGVPVGDEAFAQAWEDMATIVALVDGRLAGEGEPPLTFFELLTVLAYSVFADAPVDVAVVEVGLGGTWDATNVADPVVSVVAPIDLDHTAWLGSTVEQIAAEKSGILREDGFAVAAAQPEGAMVELAAKARVVGSPLVAEGVDFGVEERRPAVGGQDLVIRGLAETYRDIFLPLLGAHQAQNAALAVASVEGFLGNGKRGLDPTVLRVALSEVTSPGRMEVVRRSPTIIVDAAHNPAGVETALTALGEDFEFDRLVGVVGILDDKDAGAMLDLLEPKLSEVVITRSSSPRAIGVEDLATMADEIFGEDRVRRAERLDDAIAVAVDIAESEATVGVGVVVLGSVTVAAEARLLLHAPPVDAEADEDRIVQEDVLEETE